MLRTIAHYIAHDISRISKRNNRCVYNLSFNFARVKFAYFVDAIAEITNATNCNAGAAVRFQFAKELKAKIIKKQCLPLRLVLMSDRKTFRAFNPVQQYR